jgi:rhodanese-related sulfurtransferase/predicted transcriptional regulator
MLATSPKKEVYRLLARIGRGVSSPARLEILDLLAQGEKTVETLALQAGLSVKNASAHLRELRSAGLVEARREGRYVHYRLADESVSVFLVGLRAVAEARLAELREVARKHFGRRDADVSPHDRRRLLERVRAGEVTVLDVRPAAEYAAGHIPGARSVPLEELERALASIPKDQEVVAYCRGPYCVMALEAVALLEASGYRATRLDHGVAEWRAEGLPIERD